MNDLSFFGTIQYGNVVLSDIFHNYGKFAESLEKSYELKDYQINESPRPELLSYQLYGTPEYYWVLLMVNKIYDPYYDWIMSDTAVHEYTKQKYQYVGGSDSIAYHISEDGEKFWNVVQKPNAPELWYDKFDTGFGHLQYKGTLIPVTNLEHEMNVNEEKRVIKIVPPSDIKRYVSSFFKNMEGSYASL